jgi:hypothetical protein
MYTMLSGIWVNTFIFCPEDGSSSFFETMITIYHSAWSCNSDYSPRLYCHINLKSYTNTHTFMLSAELKNAPL